MPKILAAFLGYAFYFWANENLEPIHIHVSNGIQSPHATKFWITSDGVELANNNSKISDKELRQICSYIMMNRENKLALMKDRFAKLSRSEKNIKCGGVIRRLKRDIRNLEKLK